MAKQEALLSISGHEYDKDLARVPIKVSPALQAIVSNQLDLLDKVGKFCPEEAIFLEQLKLEMVQLEEEISLAFSRYMQRKEDQRLKRELKRVQSEAAIPSMEELAAQFMGPETTLTSPFGSSGTASADLPPFDLDDDTSSGLGRTSSYNAPSSSGDGSYGDSNQGSIDQEVTLDKMAAQLSPGLPSQKYEARKPQQEQQPEIDVKRVAIGASIRALESFLGRKLTEEEMVALEQQVESYLG